LPVTKNLDTQKLVNSVMRFGAVATSRALFWGDQKAKAIVYANSRISRNDATCFRNSSEAVVTSDYGNKTVTGELTFKPYNPRSKQRTSYAKALDMDHKLVYFGKPTSYWVKGKFFSGPAEQTIREELKRMFESVSMR
jgi:hypothetical protein